MLKRKNNQDYQKGYIAFTSLLVISTFTLAIATSVSLLGIQQLKASLSHKKGNEILIITESCIEEALLRLRDNSSYAGGSLNVGNGSCTISVSGTSPNYIIESTGNLAGPPDYSKKIRATVKKMGGSINILNWQEIKN